MKIKTSLTFLDVAVLVNELKEHIKGAIIDNVYIFNDIYVLKLNTQQFGELYLYLEPEKRVNTSRLKPRVKVSPEVEGKLRYLRQLLRDGKIIDVYQYDYDRIIILEVKGRKKKNYLIIIELIPRGVLTVVRPEDKLIVFASEEKTMKDRIIKVGTPYRFPPSKNILKISLENFNQLIQKGVDIIRGLVKGVGIPPEIAEELLCRLNIKKDRGIKEISQNEKIRIYKIIKRFINEVIERPSPVVVIKNEKPITVLPFKPKCLFKSNVILKEFSSLNEAIDYYFKDFLIKTLTKRELNELTNEISKLEQTIDKQKIMIENFYNKAKEVDNLLNLIYNNYVTIEKISECVKDIIKKKGWEFVKLCGNIKNFNPKEGTYIVQLEDKLLKLSVRSNLREYIISLQKKKSELMKKHDKAKEHLNQLIRKLKELKEKKIELSKKALTYIIKKEWYHKYYWLITSEGFLVIGGRNAEQNDSLIRKYLNPDDIFMHADIHGGSAVIIKTEGRKPGSKTIMEAAVIAACYSKAWKSGTGAINVFWVYGKQVSKQAPSGEFLGKGSFMIYGKKNFIKNVELKIAIGVEVKNSGVYIIQGPEELIARRSKCFVVIIPGDRKKSDVASEIRRHFIKCNKSFNIINVDDILRVVPGDSTIIRRYPEFP